MQKHIYTSLYSTTQNLTKSNHACIQINTYDLGAQYTNFHFHSDADQDYMQMAQLQNWQYLYETLKPGEVGSRGEGLKIVGRTGLKIDQNCRESIGTRELSYIRQQKHIVMSFCRELNDKLI